MTGEQVLEMERALMEQYKKAEFQDKLHEAWKAAAGDTMEQMKKRQELCLPIQIPIVTKYGFEGTKKGVAQSTAAVQAVPDQTEEMLRNHQVLMWLTDPEEQKQKPDFVPDAEVPEFIRPPKPKVYLEDLLARGSPWVVVGGGDKGGILVRKGEALDSPFYHFRLATGARLVAESDVKGKRLHYRKLTGDGPDFGWVSISVPAKGLLVKPDEVEMDDELFKSFAERTFEAAKEKRPALLDVPELLAITA